MKTLFLIFSLFLVCETTFASGFHSEGLPNDALKKAHEIHKNGYAINEFAFTKNNGWVIFYGYNGYYANNIPQDAFDKIEEVVNQGQALKSIAFTPDNGWVLFYGDNSAWWRDAPQSIIDQINAVHGQGEGFADVSFGKSSDNWVFVTETGRAYYHQVPIDLINVVQKFMYNENIFSIALHPNNIKRSAVTYEKGYAVIETLASSITLNGKLSDLRTAGKLMTDVNFTANDGWVVIWSN